MGFLDLFRPKWRHSDAEVRAEAVKELTAEDAALLAQVLHKDPDARVRRIALKKIDDPQLLGEIAENDPDEALRKDAAEKASQMLLATALSDADEAGSLRALERLPPKAVAEVARRAGHEAVRKAALARLTDDKAIADVAKKSDDPHLRKQAVDRLTDAVLLRDIASSDAVKEVALAALDKVDDEQALDTIAKKSKLKAVKSAARDKLQQLKEARAPEGGMSDQKRKTTLALICRTVEEAAASDDWSHAAKAIEVSRVSLAEIAPKKGEEVFQKRFDRAVLKFQARREEHLQTQRARAALEERKAKEAEAHNEAQKAREAEDALRAEEDKKLREISDAARKEKDELHAAERARKAEEKAKRDADKAKREADRAEARKKREAEGEDNLRRLEEVAARLESLEGSDDRKLIDGALKSGDEVARAVQSLPRAKDDGEQVRERYRRAREKLVIRSSEMREAEDWKRWSNVPKLESLCQRMEALLTAPPEADLKQLSADLKGLQAEWKTVGPAPKDKSEALWKRFKEASDQVYARCKGQGAASDEERAQNLAKKEELCKKAEELSALPDENVNWKETAAELKALQAEWKAVGAVPKAEADAVWKRFRAACDRFFDRRKEKFVAADESRQENLKKLEALIARAEALSAQPDESVNWKETAAELKALQAEWKTAGPAPKAESEAAWKRFRAACDHFFERRKARFDKLDEERQGNLKQKELLCEKVEALAAALSDGSGLDQASAEAEVKKLNADWKAIGPAPKESSDAVWNRFRSACDRVFDLGRAPEPAAPPTTAGDAKAIAAAGKFEHKAFAGIAEKLAETQAQPPAPTPTPASAAPAGGEQKAQQAQTIEDAASGWEDLADQHDDKK